LLGHRNRHYVEVQPEILIAIDGNGVVLAANRCARECLLELTSLSGRHVTELFGLRAGRLFDASAYATALVLRAPGGSVLHARVRAPAKRSSGNSAPEAVASQALAAPQASTPDVVFHAADLLERTRILAVLSQHQWRAALAAPLLGMSRATLYRRIAQFHIVAPHRQ
jgi:transcriptional regulator of acetoin/glycerol metabolism